MGEWMGREGEKGGEGIRYCVGAGYVTGEAGVEVGVVGAEVEEDCVEAFECGMFRD